MSGEYIDVIAVRHDEQIYDKVYLFQAPAWSGLRPGDKVIVETENGDKTATVLGCTTCDNDKNNKDTAFMLVLANATWPLKKVKARIDVVNFKYENE